MKYTEPRTIDLPFSEVLSEERKSYIIDKLGVADKKNKVFRDSIIRDRITED